jgi:hypothetical protein
MAEADFTATPSQTGLLRLLNDFRISNEHLSNALRLAEGYVEAEALTLLTAARHHAEEEFGIYERLKQMAHAEAAPQPVMRRIDPKLDSLSDIVTPQPRASIEAPGVTAEGCFAVRAAVPIEKALGLASCFLATAIPIASDAAEVAEGSEPWAAVYLIGMAKAGIDSVIDALSESARKRDEAAT